jgi:hypothetical protein
VGVATEVVPSNDPFRDWSDAMSDETKRIVASQTVTIVVSGDLKQSIINAAMNEIAEQLTVIQGTVAETGVSIDFRVKNRYADEVDVPLTQAEARSIQDANRDEFPNLTYLGPMKRDAGAESKEHGH